jgi:hypothetical protein
MKIFMLAQSLRSILLYQPCKNGILTAGVYLYYTKTTAGVRMQFRPR